MHKSNILIIVLCLFTFTTITCHSMEIYNNCKYIYLQDYEKENLYIEVLDISIKDEKINIGEKYPAYAIVTMEVKNNSLVNMELSNFDIYPYQNESPTKYFVSTNKENINGFIGSLGSRESKIVKMGIALNNVYDPIMLKVINDYEDTNKLLIKKMNIK